MNLISIQTDRPYDPTPLLECYGWTLLKVQGCHDIYGKTGSPIRLTIPARDKQPLKRALLKHQLMLAGLPEAEL
ncbi:type II toxin-antitoxin system HicA family toxin [Leptolyngbya sp. FACHB-261]|uniref:type II toxin-antitoxin system HicA family toxin n=1 Tax=Leptolyngbya sp. FACHB-261 TaxID=2692806 RepID=UPI001687A412|nr:type II toxin-antitoxin system HicA family toxin [Leptolyngbya sp. FACHB-261]MBD2101482.1 type II toxin-antitoxin system HicA family toxin [Leptolyngbya sp. FACHB-261]